MSLVIPPDLFRNLKTLYLLNDNNAWNRLFANKGDLVFSAIYLLMVIFTLLEHSLDNKYLSVQESLEVESEQGQVDYRSRGLYRSLRGYVLRYFMTQMVMFTLLEVRRFVLEATSIDKAKLTGFKISGHFIFLTTVGISTVLEFGHSLSHTQLFNHLRTEQLSLKLVSMFYFYVFVMVLSLLGVIVWLVSLLITAVFYHTFLEKLIGLVFGLIPPTVTYLYLVPKYDSMM
jgi:magnesium-transporting ATPase (P-type)